MSTVKTIELVTTLDDKGLNEAEAGLKQLDNQQEKIVSSSKKVETQSKKTSKGLKAVGENGGAIATLDALTGGLASRVRDTAEATKLFNFNLKGTRTALIATGIGAFIVALGLVVAYWEEIVDFITGANKQLEEQRILLESNAKLLEAQLKSINAEKALRIARGQGIDDLLLKEKALLKARIANRKEVFRTRKAELELAAQRFDEITATEEFLQLFGVDARTQEDLDKINELKTLAFEAKAAVKEAEKDLQDLENDIFDASAIVIGGEADAVKGRAEKIVDRPKNLTAAPSSDDVKSDPEIIRQQALSDAKLEILLAELAEEERLKLLAQATDERLANEARRREQALASYKIDTAINIFGALQGIAEEGSAGAKAIAIAQAVLSTYQGINKALAETTDFTPSQTLRFINAAAVGIAGFANVAKILSTDSSGKTKPSLSGGSSGGVRAPSFNVVGTSGVNQLADSLNQEQQPIQAFVVGSEVTSQQELDNQTQATATVG